MNYIRNLYNQILDGYEITKVDALCLLDCDLEELCEYADKLRKEYCGNVFDLCTIINGKSGKCSENCKFCAQSSHYKTNVAEYPLLEPNDIIEDAIYNFKQGVLRYSIVTSGRSLNDSEVDKLCNSYKMIHSNCDISLCASHGLLTYEQFCKLKEAGVTRYHNNLETSRKFFPSICTTHTYDDKIATIKSAKKAGLSVCSGGIMGLGETIEDRIDMAFELRNLSIKSIPINILNPIADTPFAYNPILTMDEVRKIIAVYRFILKDAFLRLAGGRGLLSDKGKLCIQSGVNASITGNMLTTAGFSIEEDKRMLNELGYEVTLYE